MRVYVLVSGLLRTFTETLFPFLCEYNAVHPIELVVCTPSATQDTKYNSNKAYDEQLKFILSHTFCRVCSVNPFQSTEAIPIQRTQREKNTISQWYHIESCLQNLTHIDENDIIVRLRPDIRFEVTVAKFSEILMYASKTDGILIPTGNDIFNKAFLKYTQTTINDQIAIGRYRYMKTYCTLWSSTTFDTLPSPLISEAILYSHLQENQIPIYRIDLPYTLCLSSCKIIAITGDSGVGKTTLTNAIRAVFPYDSNLVLETDRYHKWERGDEQWKKMTHLNPAANFLEKLQDDTYMLKLGEQIQSVDYDHTLGKFTDVESIDSKKYMFLCGLHTLYSEEIRSDIDLKIFIDAEYSLKRVWKIRRDMKKRGYTFDTCHDIFIRRQSEYVKYILPQMSHADICIEYSPSQPILESFDIEMEEPHIQCRLLCRPTILPYIHSYVMKFSKHIDIQSDSSNIYTVVDSSEITVEILIQRLPQQYLRYVDLETMMSGYLGLFQMLVLLILINPA
jgi:uridine kinase